MIRIILLSLAIVALLILLTARIQSNSVWWKEMRKSNMKRMEETSVGIERNRDLLSANEIKTRNKILLSKERGNKSAKKTPDVLSRYSDNIPKANDDWSSCQECILGVLNKSNWEDKSSLNNISNCANVCNMSATPKHDAPAPKHKAPVPKHEVPVPKHEVPVPKRAAPATPECWYDYYGTKNCIPGQSSKPVATKSACWYDYYGTKNCK